MRAATVAFLSLLLALPPLASAAEKEASPIESIAIAGSTTPAHHRSIARSYREKAEASRRESDRHHAMAASYADSGLHERARLREHCEKVSSAHQALATEYEALAAAHEAEAERLEAKK